MKTSASSKRSFSRGMLIYAIVFLLIVAIGLVFFWMWAKYYEQSRPTYAIKNYISSLTENHVRELSSDMLAELDSGSSENEAVDTLYNLLKDSSPAKNVVKSNDNTQVYILKNGDTYIEEVTMIPGQEGRFGFRPWIVSGEELLTDRLISASSVSVPDNWSVFWNGSKLDSSHIIGDKKEFALLNGFYDDYSNLPYIVDYSTGLHFGDGTLDVKDSYGKSYAKDDLCEALFTDNCTVDEKDSLDAFCREYISRYVSYTSVGVANGQGALVYLLELVEPSSVLYKQIRDSIAGFGFASSQGDAIQDIRILEHMNIGDNRYVCKIEYDIETYGNHSRVTDQTFPMRLVVQNNNGVLKAVAYLNY